MSARLISKACLGNLNSLTILKLNYNEIMGRIIKNLYGLKILKQLDVSNINLNIPVPVVGTQLGVNTQGNQFINIILPLGSMPSGNDNNSGARSPSWATDSAGTSKKKKALGMIVWIVVGCVFL